MWLLNAHTKCIEEFYDVDVPKYAILSHTWSKSELLFKDMQQMKEDDAETAWQPEWWDALHRRAPAKTDKVSGCCTQAIKDGLEYVWIDTCCIDKRSSAELSEAINSMYAWYRRAKVCYVYLADVSSNHSNQHDLKSSRWFTRGWTLQELLAPAQMVFFNRYWSEIARFSKVPLGREVYPRHNDVMFLDMLESATGIPQRQLLCSELTEASVAEKLSWASGRQTTRVEDEAYCLLGLFNVNMALLYGEGRKAFQRLQEEIIKTSSDHTIFAWGESPESGLKRDSPCVLAESTSQFENSGLIYPRVSFTSTTSHYSVTNQGVQITLRCLEFGDGIWNGVLVLLNCDSTAAGKTLALPLTKTTSGVYRRASWQTPLLTTPSLFQSCTPQTLYISNKAVKANRQLCKLVLVPPRTVWGEEFNITEVYPPNLMAVEVHGSSPHNSDGLWAFSLMGITSFGLSGHLTAVLRCSIQDLSQAFLIRVSGDFQRSAVSKNDSTLILRNIDVAFSRASPKEDDLASAVVTHRGNLDHAVCWCSSIDMARITPGARARVGLLRAIVKQNLADNDDPDLGGTPEIVLIITGPVPPG